MPAAVVRLQFGQRHAVGGQLAQQSEALRARCSPSSAVEQALGLEVDLGPRVHAGQPSSGTPFRPPAAQGHALSAHAGRRPPPRGESLTVIVLGIDPGLANTGYGVVARRGGRAVALDGGVIETSAGVAPERRLAQIHAAVEALIAAHEPDAVALEELYFGQNVKTAFAVGHARGVVMLAAGQRGPVRGLHPAAGQGRRLRQRSRRQGPGRAHGRHAACAAGAAAPGPSRRCARRRRLPPQPRAARRRDGRSFAHDRAAARRGRGAPLRPRRGALWRGRPPRGRLRRDAAPRSRPSARR